LDLAHFVAPELANVFVLRLAGLSPKFQVALSARLSVKHFELLRVQRRAVAGRDGRDGVALKLEAILKRWEDTSGSFLLLCDHLRTRALKSSF
jgi:hypothetical protein